MNIAFPALILFLLALPGFIFNVSFYQTENTPIKHLSISHKVIWCSAFTIILHIIGFFLLELRYNVNIEFILILISGAKDRFSSVISSITPHQILLAAIYLLILYFLSYLIGLLLRKAIRFFELEKYNMFRIDSPWYYIFIGYDWEDGKPDGVRIAAVVEIAGKAYLYIGWLDKFYLDSNGNIDRLILTGAMRRNMKNDKNKTNGSDLTDRFYPIDGHYFVLKYSEVKNLNVQFLKLELKNN